MFSIAQEPTPRLIAINLVLLFAVFLLQRRALRFPFSVSKSSRVTSIILMFVFVLYSFWGQDWFHYLEAYPELCQGNSGHMEDVYVWIAQHLSVDYISFRFAVWGTGLILLLLTIERLPLKKDLIILFFGSIWIIWFSYARVSLGLALCFYGLAVFYHPYRIKLLSRILAITAIAISFYFHKTAFVLIIAVAMTIMSLRLKKQFFFLILVISIPFIILYIRSNIEVFFMLDADADEGGLSQSIAYGQRYLGAGSNTGGIAVRIAKVIGAIPYYMLLVQSALFTVKSDDFLEQEIESETESETKSGTESKVVQGFIRLFIILVLIASLFLFDLGADASLLYVRFIRFAAFPSAVLLAYYWEYEYYPKLTRWTFYMAALSTLYSVSYSLYLKT